MSARLFRYPSLVVTLLSVLLSSSFFIPPAQVLAAGDQNGRFIVVAKSSAEYDALRLEIQQQGGKVVSDIRDINEIVVTGSSSLKNQVASSVHAQGTAPDRLVSLISPAQAAEKGIHNGKPAWNHIHVPGPNPLSGPQDPAVLLPGLMWNFTRIHAPQAWKITTGDASVKVGIADTGVDFTHSELKNKVVGVVDLTVAEDPPLCKTYFGYSDADLAAMYGGPETTDWNAHGSWVAGNIAAALDGQGINGIAPSVGLVSLKVSQWCGSAYDSTLINAFLYAANHGIRVVNMSFGGYLDRSDPAQDLIYQQYVAAVRYAMSKGTIIVSAAANDHVRIGESGQVLSHGSLQWPGDPLVDYYGLYEVPAGIPGVVDVAATNNLVNAPSETCPPGTTEEYYATCKPASDAHQPFGVGKQNQLAYYSNYGPRIDIAAPAGARKFNLPNSDRGGTQGFPETNTDGTNSWSVFSTDSNWDVTGNCYVIDSGPFYPGECYTNGYGTSIAAPQVTAVLALIESRLKPAARDKTLLIIALLKASAQKISGNTTPPLSATDFSGGDRTGGTCPTGYCHLGGAAISDREAYGAGLVDALRALQILPNW